MQDYDENPPNRPRWLGWAIIVGMILVVLGLLNIGVRLVRSGMASQTTEITQDPVALSGKPLVQSSDCMRCHMEKQRTIAPSFEEIAARYQDHPDAVTHLAQRVRDGSVGVWGRVIMPPHPQVSEQDARKMVAWVMAHHRPETVVTPPAPMTR